jgi:hypothetical protein
VAYANTVAVARKGLEILVTVTETGAGTSDEADPIGLGVQKFRVHRQICVKTAGTAATVDPILGSTTNPSGASVLVENDTAGATINNAITGGATCYSSTGNVFHRSVPNTGTNNAMTTEYHITIGW